MNINLSGRLYLFFKLCRHPFYLGLVCYLFFHKLSLQTRYLFLIFRKLTANYKSEFDLLRAPAIARNVSVPDSLCVGADGIGPSASASRTRRSTDDLRSAGAPTRN